MTDVVEAMGAAIEAQMACDDNTPADLARAAIRACRDAGGLVVGKMPKGPDQPVSGSDEDWSYHEGAHTALAAVRAAAVEVE